MPRELPEHVKRERAARARFIEEADQELKMTAEFFAVHGGRDHA
jgi:hypothetical protein